MSLPFEFEYVSRTPEGAPARNVASLWCARGTVPYERERIAPTGSTVAVFVLGDPIVQIADDGAAVPLCAAEGFLVGPHDRPAINAPTGETFAVGIVATPIGCEAVFGVRPAQLRGRVVELASVWSAAAGLRARLLDADGPESRLDILDSHLLEHASSIVPGGARAARAVAMLEAEPTRPIAQIAEALSMSHGHLCREFTRVVGQSPRSVARLLRMRGLLQAIDTSQAVPWTELAAGRGWFDQAHLIRDFKRHTGVTPTEYVRAQRAAFGVSGPGAAAGFTPEG